MHQDNTTGIEVFKNPSLFIQNWNYCTYWEKLLETTWPLQGILLQLKCEIKLWYRIHAEKKRMEQKRREWTEKE